MKYSSACGHAAKKCKTNKSSIRIDLCFTLKLRLRYGIFKEQNIPLCASCDPCLLKRTEIVSSIISIFFKRLGREPNGYFIERRTLIVVMNELFISVPLLCIAKV